MGLTEKQGKKLLGHKVDYVFLGSCTNSRIEDFRKIASIVEGKKKPDGLTVFVVPGSTQVSRQLEKEGLNQVFANAGFEMRGAGCSACLGMNEDKIPAGKYCVSTSNRNFQGRQGPGARTFLVSPITAAVAAITGKVSDVREFI
jgi:3-isopropylmalate/(R)-2-methylmalate dehydratase large subunit